MPVVYDHKNNPYKSISEMCQAYGIPRTAWDSRKAKGMSLEKILTTPVKSRPLCKRVTDHLGNEYASETEMCRIYGLSRCTYRSRLDMGWSQEEALTAKSGAHFETLSTPLVYEGKEYWSYSALGKATGLVDTSLKQIIQKGASVDFAIKCLRDGVRVKDIVFDYKGTPFPNIKAMCDAYNVSYSKYKAGIKKGLNIETILTSEDFRIRQPITDHNGKEFPSIIAKCKYHNVTYNTYKNRIDAGLSEKDALSPESYKGCGLSADKIESRTDPNGVVFFSITEMCKHYGVSLAVYTKRINEGWSKYDALNTPASNIRKPSISVTWNGIHYTSIKKLSEDLHMTIPKLRKLWDMGFSTDEISKMSGVAPDRITKDHNGNLFNSEKQMCIHYGISQEFYHKQLEKGKTQEEVLTHKERNLITAPDGTQFLNFTELCKHYSLNLSTAQGRKRNGWTLEEIIAGKRKTEPAFYVDGIGYESTAEFCRKVNIGRTPMWSRINKGMTHEEAYHDIINKQPFYDHKGNAYKSEKDMCDAYGIKLNLYKYRRDQGMGKEEALTTPTRNASLNYNGVTYKSPRDLANTLNISYTRLSRSLHDGLSIEEAVAKASVVIKMCSDHIGEEKLQKCGLKLKITEYIEGSYYNAVFEDGTPVLRMSYTSFRLQATTHPDLKKHKYMGFSVKKRITDALNSTDGCARYECACDKCGIKDIMTPQEMIEHFKTVHSGGSNEH